MFDFFRRHLKLLQYILLPLILVSFVIVGIEGYTRFNEGTQTVAKVGGYKITQTELDNSLRERVERARRQMPSLDAKIFDTPEMRGMALDALVREHVLLAAADKLHLVTNEERLDRLFKSDPQFAGLRNPDGSLNRDLLAAQNMSSEMFARRLGDDLARRQVLQGLTDSSIAPAAAASAALDALYQQREVQIQRFDSRELLAKVSPSDAELEAYYKDPSHAATFRAPEDATIEYVVLDVEALKPGITVAEADLRAYHEQNLKRFTSPEERRASHILIKADKDAPKAERDAAKAKAEALLAEVRKAPATFAAVARKNSQDEGSAEKGGDLDFFGRGAMVKPFEDAAFGLKPGEISNVVESDFGFHVIRVDEARGGQSRPYEAVKAEIESDVRSQLAQKRFAEAAVEFGDIVYEQADSLQPAATRLKLPLQRAEHVVRSPGPAASGPIGNPRFLEALFSADTLTAKRNTKAIDIGSNQLVSGRVVQYTPERQRPMAEVKAQVRERVADTQAAALARKLGTERLAAVRAAPATDVASSVQIVSRATTRDLPRPLIDAVLRAPVATLPAIVGVDLGMQGYVVAKITKIWGRDPVAGDAVQARSQYAQVWGDAESQAYYAALKTRFKASTDPAAAARSAAASSSPP